MNYDLHWCKQPDVGLPKPDLVLFLNVSAEVAATRGGFGNEIYEANSFQEKVAKRYTELMEAFFQVVDASQNIEDVHRQLKELSEKGIENAKDKPFGKLWEEESP
ncbi:hypothetical protein XELAEV_18027811mg [Xenopus laevis]|uniref:Thymidylate kinase-like domain-containing protein n=1 Tax=Xenopus laevis TaxID=8355 RepID=A0A974CX36_XENLA|nr:hypothetical protein XELAEV_18027811mg [Xenopus laevis]